MLQLHIPVEVQRDTLAPNAVLDTKIERRLGKMIKGNRDITGAAVSTKEHAPRRADAQFEARIVLYRRGANLSAHERAASESQALLAALDAIERQLRKHRTIKRTRLRA
jgi:ribosome-associated translation inhibitor RaiA